MLRIIVVLRENKRNEKEYYFKLGNQFVKNKYKLIHLLLSVTGGKGITRNPILGI